ncbi:MAG: GDSL-type esterase/lipase family protein [Trichococcus sp.]
MFIRKISITIFNLLLLSAMATGTVSAAENKKTIDYVALGDSLAAGQKPTELGSGSTKVYGTSYPKFIRDELSGKGLLNSYANFGESGKTTLTVLEPVTGGDRAELVEAIQEADVITLNIGANDLLRWVQMDDAGLSNLTKTDLANWLYTNDYQEDIFPTLQWIRSYIPGVTNEVAQKILEIRDMEADAGKPYAQIYVMGYYNAFPFLADLGVNDSDDPNKIPMLQANLDGLIKDYNLSLQTQLSSMEGVTYVDPYDNMDKHLEKYLPIDIHPTVQGYRAIAQAFLDSPSWMK